MEIAGDKALAVKTLGTVAIVSLQADGSVGNSFTSPGKHPATLTASSTRSLPERGFEFPARQSSKADEDHAVWQLLPASLGGQADNRAGPYTKGLLNCQCMALLLFCKASAAGHKT